MYIFTYKHKKKVKRVTHCNILSYMRQFLETRLNCKESFTQLHIICKHSWKLYFPQHARVAASFTLLLCLSMKHSTFKLVKPVLKLCFKEDNQVSSHFLKRATFARP